MATGTVYKVYPIRYATIARGTTATFTLESSHLYTLTAGSPSNSSAAGLYVITPGTTSGTGTVAAIQSSSVLEASVDGNTLTVRNTSSSIGIRVGLLRVSE